jgi:hypothetical protein
MDEVNDFRETTASAIGAGGWRLRLRSVLERGPNSFPRRRIHRAGSHDADGKGDGPNQHKDIVHKFLS